MGERIRVGTGDYPRPYFEEPPTSTVDLVVGLLNLILRIFFYLWWLVLEWAEVSDEFPPSDAGMTPAFFGVATLVFAFDIWGSVRLMKSRVSGLIVVAVLAAGHLAYAVAFPREAGQPVETEWNVTFAGAVLLYCLGRGAFRSRLRWS